MRVLGYIEMKCFGVEVWFYVLLIVGWVFEGWSFVLVWFLGCWLWMCRVWSFFCFVVWGVIFFSFVIWVIMFFEFLYVFIFFYGILLEWIRFKVDYFSWYWMWGVIGKRVFGDGSLKRFLWLYVIYRDICYVVLGLEMCKGGII